MSENNDPFNDELNFESKDTGNGGPGFEAHMLVNLTKIVLGLADRLDKFQKEIMDRLDKLESKDKT